MHGVSTVDTTIAIHTTIAIDTTIAVDTPIAIDTTVVVDTPVIIDPTIVVDPTDPTVAFDPTDMVDTVNTIFITTRSCIKFIFANNYYSMEMIWHYNKFAQLNIHIGTYIRRF